MNRNVALRYAHDAVVRCIEHFMSDTEWLESRFSDEDAGQIAIEIELLRKRHLHAGTTLPQPREGGVQNICEHGDHPAPAGKRFCSRSCAMCELSEHDATTTECAGLCLLATKDFPGR